MIASSDSSMRGRWVHRLDAHHVGVGDERAGTAAEHGAAARHVVELHEALRHQERMVVGQARHARAEHDVLGALGGGGDEDLGRGDQLPAGRVVLADPHLVVAEVVEPLDQLHVAVEGQRRILADAVERCQEDAELHSFVGHERSVPDSPRFERRLRGASCCGSGSGGEEERAVRRATSGRSSPRLARPR